MRCLVRPTDDQVQKPPEIDQFTASLIAPTPLAPRGLNVYPLGRGMSNLDHYMRFTTATTECCSELRFPNMAPNIKELRHGKREIDSPGSYWSRL